jgi:hypothetical protein
MSVVQMADADTLILCSFSLWEKEGSRRKWLSPVYARLGNHARHARNA